MSDKKVPLVREELCSHRLPIMLPPSQVEGIDRLRGDASRAAFVRRAIAAALEAKAVQP